MMKPLSKTHSLLTLVLVCCFGSLFAQQTFKYRAPLPKVDSDGFYKISLEPGLVAKSKADLSDIRLIDQSNRFVPYIFENQLPAGDQKDFIALPTRNNVMENDTSTIFVAENFNHLIIDQICLKLRNTAVQRTVNISGSDDLKQWYAIREGIPLEQAGTNTNGTYNQLLSFPKSTYRYLKIQINHKSKEAVDIMLASIYRTHALRSGYIKLPTATFTQKDSANTSKVTVMFTNTFQINKLMLGLSGAKYFKRNLRIYQITKKEHQLVFDGPINSGDIPTLYFSVRTATLDLEIFNGDNPPLKLNTVDAFQLEQSLISYLEKGKQYQIISGDSTAIAPEYDLKFFTDSLHKTLPLIQHGAVTGNPLYQAKITNSEKNMPAWLIWVAITVVLAVLGLLTFKMMQDVSKRKSEDAI